MSQGISGLAGREISINKANVGADILARTLAKTAEGEKRLKAVEAKPATPPRTTKPGRIDLYA